MTDEIKPVAPPVTPITSPVVVKSSAVTTPIVVPKAGLVAPISVGSGKPVVLTESAELHTQIQSIVKEHDGIESNIPHNHVYWALLNRFRTLVNK